MVCIDSDVIIDFLRNEKKAVNRIKQLKEKKIKLATTSINTFELTKGALRSNQKNAGKLLSEFLVNFEILSFDFEASEKAAEIYEDLRKKGNIIDPLDLIIASIALANNETLLTRNIKHFEKVPELIIETIK